MTRKQEVESILGRELTECEDRTFRFYFTRVFMNPFDLANRIKAAE